MLGKQLSFLIPEIDRDKTQENVEKAIQKYRIYALSIPDERLPKITASYTMVPPSTTNAFHSSTEDAAIANVDMERERLEYIEHFRKAVNKLSHKERQAFIMKYMDEEEMFDYQVYNTLGMSESYYHKKFKPRMFYKFAMAMRIEVYKTEIKRNQNDSKQDIE